MNYPYAVHIMNIELSSPSNFLNEFGFIHCKSRKMMSKLRSRKKCERNYRKFILIQMWFWTQKGSRSETSARKSNVSAMLISLQVTEIALWLWSWKA